MGYVYLIIVDATAIASGTWLVYTEHYWWAWIPFLLAATTNVRK